MLGVLKRKQNLPALGRLDGVNPTLEFGRVLELSESLLNFHEGILHYVFGGGRVRHPGADELTQLPSELMPDVFQRCVRGL